MSIEDLRNTANLTHTERLRARLAEVDQMIASLELERRDIRKLLGIRGPGSYVGMTDAIRAAGAGGREFSPYKVAKAAGFPSGAAMSCATNLGAVRVRRGIWKIPEASS